MNIEKESNLKSIDNSDDLYNEDARQRILETGSSEEIERLRKFFGDRVTPEKFKLLQDFAKLRKNTLEQMGQEIEKRKETNPKATEEELNMGCYIENIEPQVREVVTKLRQKGYDTYISGFSRENQKISFEEEYPILGKQWIENLNIQDVDIHIDKNSIVFTCKRFFTLAEMKNIWGQIEQALPPLGKTAKPRGFPQAELFRQKQAELNI